MKVSASVLDMMNAIKSLKDDLENIGIVKLGDKMGQLSGYDLLQQQQSNDAYRYSLANSQNPLGMLGGLGIAQQDLRAGQAVTGIQIGGYSPENKYAGIQNPIYPGKVIYDPGLRDVFNIGVPEEVCKVAAEFGFVFDYNSMSFINKETGGTVTRPLIEGNEMSIVRKIFQKAKTPNISWLDDRVNEMRVKLI